MHTYQVVLLTLLGVIVGAFVLPWLYDEARLWWRRRRLYNPAPYRLAAFGGYQHRRRFGRADRRTR